MARIKDITGNVYNNLSVIKYVGINKWGSTVWECECNCDKHTRLNVNAGDLKSGRVKSCGCLVVKHAKDQAIKNRNPNIFETLENGVSKMYDNKGNFTLIDTEDIERLKQYCWYKHTNNYWVSYSPNIQLHRFIMNCPKGLVVDHIHFNLDDHRKTELKVCTILENNQNNRARKNKMDCDLPVGVTRTKSGKFKSFIQRNGEIHQKTCNTLNEAIDFRKQFI